MTVRQAMLKRLRLLFRVHIVQLDPGKLPTCDAYHYCGIGPTVVPATRYSTKTIKHHAKVMVNFCLLAIFLFISNTRN